MSAQPAVTASANATRDYTISQLAKEFDVTARTLRFYEDKGLLTPKRLGQSRIYTSRERAKLKLIIQGKRVGLPLDEIKDVLSVYELRGGKPEELRANLAILQKQIDFLQTRRVDIDQAITAMNDTCNLIGDLLKNHNS